MSWFKLVLKGRKTLRPRKNMNDHLGQPTRSAVRETKALTEGKRDSPEMGG